jgi:hypothetical protein
MTALPPDFQFSQSSLQDAADCLRRFWLRHVLRLRYPAPVAAPVRAYELHLLRGDRLHRLIQSTLNGMPADSVRASAADDPVVVGWYDAWLLHGLTSLPTEQRRAEIELSAPVPGWPDGRIVAKYDLLAEGGGQIAIVDWKTAERAPSARDLAERWQTIIYRWMLARARPDIPPEAITMIYWYAGDPARPTRLPYSAAQFERDEARIRAQIDALLADIAVGEAAFPRTDDDYRCRYCSYRTLCERGAQPGDLADLIDETFASDDPAELRIDFDQIAEIAF